MAITASDVLFAKQAPEVLAQKLGKGITVDEAFFMEQNPYPVADKLGISADTVFFAESGSAEFANAVNSLPAEPDDGEGEEGDGGEEEPETGTEDETENP